MAAALGLGIDESYMVVAGRGPLQLGYFDHPLVSWWMARGMADATGSEAAWVVRVPFIALFALSTAMMAELGRVLFSARAGLWAAVAFNLAPVFGITTGGWVLPDGPMVAGLLGAALCLVHALTPGGRWSWAWWQGAGLCAGLAMLSKYTSVLPLAGCGLYLLTQPTDRRWLRRWPPYAAAGVAFVAVCPVIIWNAGHGWASLAFQTGRAAAFSLHPFGPLVTLGGEALFLLPWIWAGLIWVWLRALREGPGEWRDWLMACLAAPAIVLFVVVSFWSRQVLFHWAAPGYLFAFPLLGAWLCGRRWAPQAARWTAGLIAVVAVVVILGMRTDWPNLPGDPALQVRDWSALRGQLAERHLLGRPVAAPSWSDTGKLGIGLGPDVAVFCLNGDAREFRFSTTPPRQGDVVIVAPRRSPAQMLAAYGGSFARIETLAPLHLGRTVVPLYVGYDLIRWP